MKRKIALALTMAMLGTCLAGCGQADTDTNASTEAKDTTAAAGTAAAETTESEKEWYGTEDGKTITLHFWGGVHRSTDMMICVPTSMRSTKTKDFR